MYIRSLVILIVIQFVNTNPVENEPYIVPRPKIEIFRPRGLRISIPDHPGIRLFAFHGAVNRELNGLEAGDLSKDILTKTDDRWVFSDKKTKLNLGDVLRYWLFVIRGNLGYRLDNQSFIVTRFEEAPPGFINNNHGPNRKTTTQSPSIYGERDESVYIPQSPSSSSCHCPIQPLQPITIIPPICIQLPTTTPLPITSSRPETPSHVPDISLAEQMLWKDIALNESIKNNELREQLLVLSENMKLLREKVERMGDENINKLLLTGDILKTDIPLDQVRDLFKEKLGIRDVNFIKAADRNPDGSISIELHSLDDKLFVLRQVKAKLTNSKIIIRDYDLPSAIQPRIQV